VRDSWAAIDVGTDPIARARALTRAHELAFVDGKVGPVGVRELVRASWKRSLAAGVAADQVGAPVRFTGDELVAARERCPLAPVVSVIRSELSGLDGVARHIVAVGDAFANLLWVSGDPLTCERARAMRFQEGAAWSEQEVGTNAVGTVVAVDHPLQIFSAEHLVQAVHEWSCSAAPVHDPVNGELIGVVDLTADFRTSHPHTLFVAALAARAAEAALRALWRESVGRLRERWETAIAGRRSASALLDSRGYVIAVRGVDGLPMRFDVPVIGAGRIVLPDGRVGELEQLPGGGSILWLRRPTRRHSQRVRLLLLGRGANVQVGAARREMGLRSFEVLAVLAMHPEGLTAEQLALALYGERGKTVTVRAQVHRLRRCLGPGVLAAYPYRLAVPVEADWLDVARLVALGRADTALRAYRGALLPASDVPEIVEARRLLEESLRRSIVTSGDAELLSRWLAHPAGADDLAAARALVAVLPRGDTRRAAATASAAAIARRTVAVAV